VPDAPSPRKKVCGADSRIALSNQGRAHIFIQPGSAAQGRCLTRNDRVRMRPACVPEAGRTPSCMALPCRRTWRVVTTAEMYLSRLYSFDVASAQGRRRDMPAFRKSKIAIVPPARAQSARRGRQEVLRS